MAEAQELEKNELFEISRGLKKARREKPAINFGFCVEKVRCKLKKMNDLWGPQKGPQF